MNVGRLLRRIIQANVRRRCRQYATKNNRAGAPSAVNKVVTISSLRSDFAGNLSDELLAFGVTSAIESQDDQAQEDIFQGEKRLWESCKIVAFFEEAKEIDAILKEASENIGCHLSKSQIQISEFQDTIYKDWIETAKDAFKPIQVSDDISVVPVGHKVEEQDNALTIHIEPGLAFGTGEHQTTKLCLRWLKQYCDLNKGKIGNVIDYGTGSGVLAIAAIKLGANRVLATDIEADSLIATERNLAFNGIVDKKLIECKLVDHNLVLQGKADQCSASMVVANILCKPLLELKDVFTSILPSGGKLAVSGILAHQVKELIDIYSPDFCDFEEVYEDDWALVTATKK